MFRLRAAKASDLARVWPLIQRCGSGLTTLQLEEDELAERLQLSESSFAGAIAPEEADYVFVLEDMPSGTLAGISAIKAAVGLDTPFYNYRISAAVHASRPLNIYTKKQTLFLTNDYTGCAELCSLFLDEPYRHGDLGRLLSKGRLMFAVQQQSCLPDLVIAEIRGFQNEQNQSPFWESLGQRFYQMDFDQADTMTGRGQKAFIAELMPRYPVYTEFLSEEARAALGREHPAAIGARRLLEGEGFRYAGYVDIFDAGPVLQCAISDLRFHYQSRTLRAERTSPHVLDQATPVKYLVCTFDNTHFKAIVATTTTFADQIFLQDTELQALEIEPGTEVRVATLNPADASLFHSRTSNL